MLNILWLKARFLVTGWVTVFGMVYIPRGVAKGGPGGPGTPQSNPTKIIKDKTCTH